MAVVIGTPAIQTLTSAIQLGATEWSTIALVVVFLIFVSTIFVLNTRDLSTVWGLMKAPLRVAGEALMVNGEIDPAEHLQALVEKFGLTPREHDVAQLLTKGRSLPFICKELHIARGTAQTHIDHIYKKLGVHNRQEFLDLVEKFTRQPQPSPQIN